MRCSTNQAHRPYRTLAVALWMGAIPVIADEAASQEPAAGAKTETVSLYLNVEKNGQLISGLLPGNFRLTEDGHSRTFRLEQPEEPASIAFLIEQSTSSSYFLEDIAYALNGFEAHGIDGHWYALATYSNMLEIHTDFTKQRAAITQQFAALGPPTWNEIDTYDAIYEMLDKMSRLPGRHILVVIGTGVDTFSEHNLDDVKKKIEADNVTVFAAGIGSMLRGVYDPYISSSGQMQLIQAQAFLQMLASKSGGFAWFPKMSVGFHDVMEGIMQSIATQYRMVYDTRIRGTGKFRKIKVEAFRVVNDKRENFKVLVREGWR
ncbi:MAG TPA: VWA domain-containing protein [Bryobacteraceae bacterium]|nr:VWA domain-containing protein [Bryobacteraceae bacterium]